MRARVEIRPLLGLFAILTAIGCYDSHDLPPEPVRPDPGAACRAGSDCLGGLLCIVSDTFPGGYCSVECDAGCPDGTRCDRGYLDGLCLATCTDSSECRSGYHCFGDVCRPPCSEDAECGSESAFCVRSECSGVECVDDDDCRRPRTCMAGRCVASLDGGGDLPVGAPCTLGSECATTVCLPPSLGGTCALPCASRRDCAVSQPCAPARIDEDGDGRADVVVGACVDPNPEGRLLAGRCRRDDQCASWSCLDSQCVELCEEARDDCLPGHICTLLRYDDVAMGLFSGCGFSPRDGRLAVETYPVGTYSVSSSGLGARINVAVPNDTVSVTFVATHSSRTPLAYQSLFSPDELTLFDLVGLSGWEDQPIRWIPLSNEEAATISVPSSTPDRVRVQPGRYSTRLVLLPGPGDPDTSDVDLSMQVKRVRVVDRGVIDLEIYPVGIGFDAATAPDEMRLAGALSRLRGIWDAIGLEIGEVRYRDVPPEVVSRLSVIDSVDGPDSEMAELLRLSAGGAPGVVSLFLVRSISPSRDGAIALGIAGGIPGPPAVHGTMHSGVLISYDASVVGSGTRGERNIAQVIAHETGHFLGLYHNRERLEPCAPGTGPTMADPCAPFGGEDVIADTSRRDGDNLMWWALGGDTGRRFNVTLTDGQAYVLLRSPLVRD